MIEPDLVAAQRLYAEGVALQQRGQLADAISAWNSAIALDRRHADARYNLAVAFGTAGDTTAAEACYRELLSQHPDHPQALYNLANLKMRQGDGATAEPLYRHLLRLAPDFANGWINLAMARSGRDDFVEAESCLRRALALAPDNIAAHWSLANLLLGLRRWEEGWGEYEWRLRRPQCPPPPVATPAWSPADHEARRILLWNDQGMGDALQFARYIPLLASRGHAVWLLVQDALKGLLQSVPGVTGVIGPSDAIPPVDAHAPLLSLPHRLGVPDPKQSWNGAYVKAPRTTTLPQRRAGCRAIGLVWASNPTHPNRALRDVPFAQLEPLLRIPNVDWFGLQVGAAAQDIVAAGAADRVHDLSPRINDFADTAAAVAALDLVITVDTSMPHLIGAMGKPGWAMISTATEWRWGGAEETSLWYPSVRLFRQSAAGDWSGVLAAIAAELRSDRFRPEH